MNIVGGVYQNQSYYVVGNKSRCKRLEIATGMAKTKRVAKKKRIKKRMKCK
jgi:hypothetical protein